MRKAKRKHLDRLINRYRWICIVFCFIFGIWWFSASLSGVEAGEAAEEKKQLELSIRRAAAACYASEGVYPPDLEYLEEHYGIQVNRDRFIVYYGAIASNLMPDITILDNTK